MTAEERQRILARSGPRKRPTALPSVREAPRAQNEATERQGGCFTVPGDPVPQPRPRIFRNGGVGEDPRATRQKQATIMAARRAKVPRLTGEVELSLVYFRANHRRVDLDNLAKLTQDALTGIAYLDDSQIVSLHASKGIDAAHPRTEVTVRPWPPVVAPTSEFINAWEAVHEHGQGEKRHTAEQTTAGRAYHEGAP